MEIIAMSKVTPERAIALTLLAIKIGCCVPPSAKPTKFQVTYFKIVQYLSFVSGLMLLVPLLYASYLNANNPGIMVPSVCMGCVVCCGVVQIVVCAFHARRLRYIIFELEEYCKRKESYVKQILQRYVDKHMIVSTPFTLWIYFNVVLFAVGPIFLPQPLPIHAEYSLPLHYLPLKSIIFVHQIFAGLQCAGQVCLNIFCALLFWFTVAKFEVLALEFRMVNNCTDMHKCIREHERLLRFAKEVTLATRFIMLSELIFGTVQLIFSALTLTRDNSAVEKVQYAAINFTALLSSFMSIWPADNLMYVNLCVANGAYEAKWYNQPMKLQKSLLIVLLRCWETITVSVGCVLPAASLSYYRGYISTAVSYFTVLHIVLESDTTISD